MSLRRTLSVVMPAFNEALNLDKAVRAVVDAAEGLEDFEILVVDDGSIDGTADVADRLARQIPQVRVIQHERNRGFSAAFMSGLAAARLDYFTPVPGDGEIDADTLHRIFAAIGQADLVVTYHATPAARACIRRVVTWICTNEVNRLFGWRLQYYQGPTVYPTAVARALPPPRGFFLAEMLIHALAAGYTWVQVGLHHKEREHGTSTAVNRANLIEGQRAVMKLWWDIRVRGVRSVPRAVHDQAGQLAGGAE